MSPQTLGIIIGGLVPAFFFGFANVLVKAATESGLSVSWILIASGVGAIVVGGVLLFVVPDQMMHAKPTLMMVGSGMLWGTGIACVTMALTVYAAPISVVVPLYNMNTLVAVLLALWVFAEWKQVHVPQLLIGSVCVIVGGVLVARA